MTRGRAAGLAVPVLGLLGWSLFRGGPSHPTGPVPEPRTPGPASGDNVSHGDTNDRAPSGGKPEPSGSSTREKEAEDAPPAELPTSDGACVLEDGTPLPGVQFWIQQGGGIDVAESGPDGTVRIRRDVPVVVSHATAPVSADGGTLSLTGRGTSR